MSNQFSIAPYNDDVRIIVLTNGGETIVDAADYEWASLFKWRNSLGYARRDTTPEERRAGAPGTLALHRLIMNAPPGILVDHWDRDTLNNRRGNKARINEVS